MPITQALLDQNRRELLDLSTRNRLLSIPVKLNAARVIHVRDELSAEVYRLLVDEQRSISFLTNSGSSNQSTTIEGEDEIDAEVGLPQPEEEAEAPSTGPAKRHVDSRLQTGLSSEGLQRRLLDLYRDAQTMLEEQGVNILYLALGQLKWFEREKPETPRYAPLVLVPVALIRSSAADRFRLRAREEDVEENLSLAAKLKADFSLELPGFPSEETFDLPAYLSAVSKVVAGLPEWEVLPNAITLGFFSFAKFLLYRDLDADNWPKPDDLLCNPFIASLLQDGFTVQEPPFPEDVQLDELIPVEQLDHIVDADSSQTLAIEMARRGRSLVIQGPPGTGKSQSITNLIATAILDGKRVLFVAEKLAALDVVKRRLEREGLGPLCLELHSNKASKRAVLEEIGRTWKLGRPKAGEIEALIAPLARCRDELNTHVASLHAPLKPTELTPFNLLGRLAELGERAGDAAALAFPGAESWSAAERGERRALLVELGERITQIGLPSRHPWRGVGRTSVLKLDIDRILGRIQAARERISQVEQTAAALARLLSQPAPVRFADAGKLQRFGEHIAQAPSPLDKQALLNDAWATKRETLRELLAHGQALARMESLLGAEVIEEAWARDFRGARIHLAAHGASFLRVFNSDYRHALAEVRGVTKKDLPQTHPERLAWLDGLLAGQRAYQGILANDEVGRAAFGSVWRREKTDWTQTSAILAWVTAPPAIEFGESFRRIFAGLPAPGDAGHSAHALASQIPAAEAARTTLDAELKLDPAAAFGCASLADVSFNDWRERGELWAKRLDDLASWSNYYVRAELARNLGLAPLLVRLADGSITAMDAADAFDRIYFSQLLREAIRQQPSLGQFDGELHARRVSDFKKLDRERLNLAKHRVLAAHYTRLPASAGAGATGIVKAELERKRGHRSVRRLLKDAGSVVQAIKPVFMMSPLSVAQFLEPGAVEFDLLVIDEASQVQPVDALGAIARCKQIVVVGDSRQLPPTRFFSRVTGDTPDLENDESTQAAGARDVESILGLCRARGLPERMLRWHYRSRHHSLIAVSNHEFYENQLFIVPSPWAAADSVGLRFQHVPDGVFDRGGSGVNRLEARAVSRAVIAHARQAPQLSLGVAAFSLRQQQAILDELELLRRENTDTESFFGSHEAEPFFVKNLENVQGDERDVVFISVGYGRDHSGGVLSMNFGPLGADGGERRLNVLISRAKQRCEVFSSITADEIDLERAKGRGVRALKTFLNFAQTGRIDIAKRTALDEQSPFEEVVRHAVEALGYLVHPQVGLAGFFIDLAVADPDQPERYLLGIECDGATYHSARSARDRDRLRQTVLEDHGWSIHRVWSTDWFQRPAEQIAKIASAIEQAKAAVGRDGTGSAAPAVLKPSLPPAEPSVEREAVAVDENPELSALAKPYVEARFEVPRATEPQELPPKQLNEILLKVIELEGPIHEDEIVIRVKELWGLNRAGSRLQDAVARGIRALLVSKQCVREEGCLRLPDSDVSVRNRENVISPNLRKPDFLPAVEVRAAILLLVGTLHGATPKELPTAVARVLGFKTTLPALRASAEAQLAKLLTAGTLEEQNGLLRMKE